MPKYFALAAQAWLGERTLTSLQLIQAAGSALIGGCDKLLVGLSVWLVRHDIEGLKRFAKDIALFSHLSLGDDSTSKFSVPCRFIFRQAQMRVAAVNSAWDTYAKLDLLVINLLQQARPEQLIEDLRLQHFVSTAMQLDSPTPFAERLARALAVVEMDLDGVVSRRLNLNRQSPCRPTFIAMMASLAAKTPDDLELWVETVGKKSTQERPPIFQGFDWYSDSYALFLGHVWQNVSRMPAPNWHACLRAFSAVRSLGESVGNAWLVAASVRASMIVLDEFMQNPREAIELANDARRKGYEHPLIDLAQSMVCYRADDDVGAVGFMGSTEERVSKADLVVERLFALANGLRAADRLYGGSDERISRLRAIAARGKQISEFSRSDAFGAICGAAFTAELAWMADESGDYRSAVELFRAAIDNLESFPEQTNRLCRSLHLRLGHVILWLSRGAFKSDMLETPSPGLLANFAEPMDVKPGAAYPMLWACLAEYAAVTGQTNECRRLVRRARSNEGRSLFLAVLQSAEASFLANLRGGQFPPGAGRRHRIR